MRLGLLAAEPEPQPSMVRLASQTPTVRASKPQPSMVSAFSQTATVTSVIVLHKQPRSARLNLSRQWSAWFHKEPRQYQLDCCHFSHALVSAPFLALILKDAIPFSTKRHMPRPGWRLHNTVQS
eukprot:1161644-Pelagomonas_calceolata.AAC.6